MKAEPGPGGRRVVRPARDEPLHGPTALTAPAVERPGLAREPVAAGAVHYEAEAIAREADLALREPPGRGVARVRARRGPRTAGGAPS